MYYNNLCIDINESRVNRAGKSIELTINAVGFLTINPNSEHPANILSSDYYSDFYKGRITDEFQLIYITNGGGKLLVEDKRFILKNGDVFVIYPKQRHSYTPNTETGWSEYYICFEGKEMLAWIENSFPKTETQVYDIGYNEELVKLYRKAIELISLKKQSYRVLLSGLVYHMISLCIFEIDNASVSNNCGKYMIERAKKVMNENVYETFYTEELAERLSVNYNSFRKEFKKYTGCAPNNYFIGLKVTEAKQILQESTLSIKEIASKLQFYSADHFGVVFKKKTGYSPSVYRSFTRNQIIQ